MDRRYAAPMMTKTALKERIVVVSMMGAEAAAPRGVDDAIDQVVGEGEDSSCKDKC